MSRRWAGVVAGFGDGGSGAGFVDEVLAGGAGGDECGEGEAVDGAGFAAAGLVDERGRVVGESGSDRPASCKWWWTYPSKMSNWPPWAGCIATTPGACTATSTTYRPQSSRPRSTLQNGPTRPWSKSNSPSLHQNTIRTRAIQCTMKPSPCPSTARCGRPSGPGCVCGRTQPGQLRAGVLGEIRALEAAFDGIWVYFNVGLCVDSPCRRFAVIALCVSGQTARSALVTAFTDGWSEVPARTLHTISR